MEVVECDNVESPDTLEDMVLALNEGYLGNKRLMDRLEQMLRMSKLPADVKNFASVVVEYYNDVMKSVLDMMGIVTELIKEYAHLVQVHYGLRMGEELHRVKNIFLLLEPQKYQPYITTVVKDSCRIAAASTCGRRTLSSGYASSLLRNNLYLIKLTVRVYLREARGAKRMLNKEVKLVEYNWHTFTSLYWEIFKETFDEVL